MISNYQSSETIFLRNDSKLSIPTACDERSHHTGASVQSPASLGPFLLNINGFFFLDLLFSFLHPTYPANLPMVDACFSFFYPSASSAEGSPPQMAYP